MVLKGFKRPVVFARVGVFFFVNMEVISRASKARSIPIYVVYGIPGIIYTQYELVSYTTRAIHGIYRRVLRIM